MQEVMAVILDIQSKRARRAKMAARNELRLVLNGNKQDAPGTDHNGCDDSDDGSGVDNDVIFDGDDEGYDAGYNDDDDDDDDEDEGYDDDAVFVLENDDDIVIVDERNAAGQYRIVLSKTSDRSTKTITRLFNDNHVFGSYVEPLHMILAEKVIVLSIADYARKSVCANDMYFKSDAAKNTFMAADLQIRERLDAVRIYSHKYVFMNDTNGRKVAIAVIPIDTVECAYTDDIWKSYKCPALFSKI
jgi:hypothetical protein